MAMLARFCSKMDQRFSADLEREFKQSLEPGFVSPIYIGAVLTSIGATWTQLNKSIDVDDYLSLFHAFKNMLLVLLSAISILAVTSRRWLARRLFHLDLELLVVTLGAVGIVVTVFGAAWYSAHLAGRDPLEVFGHRSAASEVMAIMVISTVTTATCLAMPLRSHLLWVLPMVGMCTFCVATALASSPYPQALPELLFYACALSGFSMLGGVRNESHLRKEWLAKRQIVKQTDLSEKQRQCFLHLLNRLCDCLLYLGPNLEILEPSPNMAAMLFISNGSSLQGNNFCDYIASGEDRDRFIETMESSSQEDHAGILALHLRDVESREVQVHVYYTSFHGQDNSRCHIVGIAEAGASEGVAEAPPERSVRHSAPTTTERPSITSESSDQSSESQLTLESVSGAEFNEIAVTIESGPGLSIISCTPGFTSLCGPIGNNAQFADWLFDRVSFERSVQDYVNAFHNSSLVLGEIVMRLPTAANVGIVCVINECAVDSISTIYNDDGAGVAYAIRMRFNGVRQAVYKYDKPTWRKAAKACMAKARPRKTRLLL